MASSNDIYLFERSGTQKVMKMDGFSASILDSFSPGSPNNYWISWDGTDIYACISGSNKIVQYTGFSADIYASFDTGSETKGLTIDKDGNVLAADVANKILKKYNGFSGSVTSSFSYDGVFDEPNGISVDENGNLLLIEENPHKVRLTDGFSSEVDASFTNGSLSNGRGVSWDGTNAYSCDFSESKAYEYSGFSHSILATFSQNSIWSIEWGNYDNRTGQAVAAAAKTLMMMGAGQ